MSHLPNLAVVDGKETVVKEVELQQNHRRKLPQLRKDLIIEIQGAHRIPSKQNQKTNSPWYIVGKTLRIQNKYRAWKAAVSKEKIKTHATYKEKSRIKTVSFSVRTLKSRRAWNNIFQVLL